MTKQNSLKRNKIKNYLLIGITAFIVEYGSFTLLYTLLENLVLSQTASFTLGLVISFLGNRTITFSRTSGYRLSASSQMASYFLLALINLILSNLVIHLLIDAGSVAPALAKVVVMGMVVIWNYLIFNKLIFRSQST